MTRNKRIILLAGICVAVLGTIIGVVLYRKFAPNKDHMELTKYFQMDKNGVKLILGDEISEADVLYQDRQVYVDINTIKERLNKRFYWDANENVLLYTTPNAVISAEPGSKDCFKNNSRSSKEYEIVRVDAEKVYVALDYVKEYTALEYKVYNKPTRVVISNE